MPVNTWFNTGEIDKVFTSSAPGYLRALAAFSYGHPDDVKMVLNSLIKNIENFAIQDKLLMARASLITTHIYERDETRVKLLLNQIASAENVDNRVFGMEVLESAYQFIYKLNLESSPFQTTLAKPDQFAVFGDSHILGMSHCFKNGRFVYVPGIRYSLLTSPQTNAKIVGLRNFFANHYTSKHILLNIGEIDVRSTFVVEERSNKLKDELLTYQMKKWMLLVKSLAAEHQEVSLIIPFCRQLDDTDQWEKYDLFVELFRSEAAHYGFNILEYPSILEDGLIDHAHCRPLVYEKLICDYVNSL